MKSGSLLAALISAFALACSQVAAAEPAEPTREEVLQQINRLRGVDVPEDQAEVKAANAALDNVWSFLREHSGVAMPLLAEQLEAELARPRPDDFFLLDAGSFLGFRDEASGRDLALRALERLDSSTKIVQANFQQLFDLARGLGKPADPRSLAILDRHFLLTDEHIYVPQHALDLGPELVCVFLYGVHGRAGERHLLSQLTADGKAQQRILAILTWIGSPESVETVGKVMLARKDRDTFERGFDFMVTLGGPAGRDFLLGLDLRGRDEEVRKLHQKARNDLKDLGFAGIRRSIKKVDPEVQGLSEDELRRRLQQMYENHGKDDSTHPLAVLDSTLTEEYLIEELIKIRARMFDRLSDEALYDVRMTNLLVNGLYFRKAEAKKK